MKANDALKAILKMDGLDDDTREALEGLTDAVTSDASNARAAADRKKAERKTAEAIAALEEYKQEVEDEKAAGSSDKDKQARMVEKLTARAEAAELAAKKASDSMAEQSRTIAINNAVSGINFSEKISPEVRTLMVTNAFKDMDTEDLAVTALTSPVVESFVAQNPAIIVKSSAGGAGTKGGNADGSSGSGAISLSDLDGKSFAEIQAMESKIVAAHAAGELS